MMSSLPQVQVPLAFLPTFNFLQRLRIVYFHRLLVRINNGSTSLLRIIAVTSGGDLGFFHIDGSRKGTISLPRDLQRVSFNNRCVFLEINSDQQSEDVESDSGVITLDFDTSSALIRGNETNESAIKRFLSICSHFSRGISIQRAATLEQQRQQIAQANTFEPLVAGNDLPPRVEGASGTDGDGKRQLLQQQGDVMPKSPRSFPSFSSRRKAAGSTFQKLFSGFSGVWTKDAATAAAGTGGADGGSVAGYQRGRGDSGASRDSSGMIGGATSSGDDSDAGGGFGGGGGEGGRRRDGRFNFNSNSNENSNENSRSNFHDGYQHYASPSGGDEDDDEEDPNATVSVESHVKQRRRMNRWREEIFSRLGERAGVDAKERILDDLARLEGSLQKQQSLIESPPPPSDEEELVQQRALAALVMFICRRQSMLIDAKATVIPEIRPKTVFSTANQLVPNSVPVLASYTDAFRSQFLG